MFLLLCGDRSVGGWISHHIRSWRDSASGQKRRWGRVLAARSAECVTHVHSATQDKPIWEASGSDFSGGVGGSINKKTERGAFFILLIIAVIYKQCTDGCSSPEVKTDACDSKSSNSLSVSHKDFASFMMAIRPLVSVLQLEPVGIRQRKAVVVENKMQPNGPDLVSLLRSTRLGISRCSTGFYPDISQSVSCTRWSRFVPFSSILIPVILFQPICLILQTVHLFDRYPIDSLVNNGGSSSFRQLLINSLQRWAPCTVEY